MRADTELLFQTTSTNWVAVPDLGVELETQAGIASVLLYASAKQGGQFQITIDGKPASIYPMIFRGDRVPVQFSELFYDLPPGKHTFELHCRAMQGVLSIFMGNGGYGLDSHPQLWVKSA